MKRISYDDAYNGACQMFDTTASDMKSIYNGEIEKVESREMSWAKMFEILMIHFYLCTTKQNLQSP